jgi:hypothetical protein
MFKMAPFSLLVLTTNKFTGGKTTTKVQYFQVFFDSFLFRFVRYVIPQNRLTVRLNQRLIETQSYK